MVDAETGLQPNSNTKKIIYESFKPSDNYAVSLEKSSNKVKLGLYDSKDQKKILRFY